MEYIQTMKTIKVLLGIITLSITACVNYPKSYTYSPTVTVGGDSKGDINLPSPFAKTTPKVITNVVTKTVYKNRYIEVPQQRDGDYSSDVEPSPLNTYVPEPPRSTGYYYGPAPHREVVYLN